MNKSLSKNKDHKSKGHRVSKQEEWNFNPKIIVVIILIIGIIAVFYIIIAKLTTSSTNKQIACENMALAEKEESVASPFDVNECVANSCSFDVTLCSDACPFGFENDKDNCPVSCSCAEKGLFDSDVRFFEENIPMLLDEFQHKEDESISVFAGSARKAALWKKQPNGRVHVPYFSNSPDAYTLNQVAAVSNYLSQVTCIDILPKRDDDNSTYILVSYGNGCNSAIGASSLEYQILSLGEGCAHFAVVLHEFLHALGFWHEQARTDRDNYIEVQWDNIEPGKEHNFNKRTNEETIDVGFEYDYSSLMHYHSLMFRAYKKRSTFVKIPSQELIKKRPNNASKTDIAELNALYDCNSVTAKRSEGGLWTEWGSWTECSRKCGIYGKNLRKRKCQNENGEFAYGCVGDNTEKKSCNTESCGGEFTLWSKWADCTVTCGTGRQDRKRGCTVKGGCRRGVLAYIQGRNCERGSCDALPEGSPSWTPWTKWSDCSPTNWGERRTRKMKCLSKEKIPSVDCLPYGNGKLEYAKFGEDLGYLTETEDCNEPEASTTSKQPTTTSTNPTTTTLVSQTTILTSATTIITTLATTLVSITTTSEPVGGVWTKWEEWSQCSATCEGTIKRVRQCKGTKSCLGEFEETNPCGEDICKSGITSDMLGQEVFAVEPICKYGKISVGKFNEDDRMDLVCYYPDGWVRLYYALPSGAFDSISWEGATQFCRFVGVASNNIHHITDVNGDEKDDLLCQNPKTGQIEISLSRHGIFQNKLDWRKYRDICGNDDSTLLHDINGDEKADIICVNFDFGVSAISLNTKKEEE